MKGTVIFPGAFKPPHKGHFNAVKALSTNSFIEASYILLENNTIKQDSIVPKENRSYEVDKVIVLIGSQVRDNIDATLSKEVWDIYKKYLPSNVEIINTNSDPVKFAKRNIVEKSPTTTFFISVLLRDHTDYKDLRRLGAYKKYSNVNDLVLYKNFITTRATNLREQLKHNNIHNMANYFPSELSEEDLSNISGKIFETALKEVVSTISTNSSKLKKKRQLEENAIDVPVVSENQGRDTELTKNIKSLTSFMVEHNFKITPLPVVKIDTKTRFNEFFRKTAEYIPDQKKIILYTDGRHPKDVVRSFAHEMIHHQQNLKGELKDISGTNITEDDTLLTLEAEAYLQGNLAFRSWEDTVKNR